jgi:tripartite-type tricarboxylate transporter receptor subunit TctC
MTRMAFGRFSAGTLLALTFALVSTTAQAQTAPAGAYPNRLIKIIVPYSAGGGTDVVARVIGEKLGERLGQPIIIENKPGAGARLGTEFVATQPADGYTILIAGGSEMAISPLIAKVNYSAATSF